ncbi:hypothetical protein CBS101457_004072 [Exobasidium rhododendri]|nr:hypothetical protein CBS101457_004072 [Exobasidium rhododendri]
MPEATTGDGMEVSPRICEPSNEASTSFRTYSTDEFGTLRVSNPPEEGRILLALPRKKKHIVHKMARGMLANGTQVLALARQDGQIDIFDCKEEKLLTFYRPNGMRENIHRWVGLAVAPDGIYSCTSAGSFDFTSLDPLKGEILEENNKHIELPEPLQALAFEPESDPKFFAFGGEEVPLSVWDISKARSAPPPSEDEPQDSEGNDEGESDNAPALSGKAKKRKRIVEKRAKAKEYKWGEIWRAKNLPNDALSLAQKASIISVVFLENSKLATGHKNGMLRLFETGSQRKAVKEIKLFQPKMSPVKHLARSHNDGELIAADTNGRVYVVNWRSGTIQYKYEVFSGAATSLCSLPPYQGSRKRSNLATASTEKLLRMHDMPLNADLLHKTKENGKIVSTKFYEDGVTNLIWDGVIPRASLIEQGGDSDGGGGEGESGNLAADQDDDDVWQRMAPIDDDDDDEPQQHHHQRRRTTTNT